MSIDATEHQFVVEELDDQTLVIKESQLKELKRRLDEVNVHR
jgi:TFIIH basal transcription factor complex TTD-A subunit